MLVFIANLRLVSFFLFFFFCLVEILELSRIDPRALLFDRVHIKISFGRKDHLGERKIIGVLSRLRSIKDVSRERYITVVR